MADESSRPPTGRLLARNTLWNYASVAVNLVVNVLLFRYVVAHLGDARSAIWLILSSVSGYLGLLQLGTVPAVLRFVAAHHAVQEHEHVSRIASTALALLLGLGLLPLVALPGLPRLAEWLTMPADVRGEFVPVFAVGLVNVAVATPGHIFNAVLSAVNRQDRCSQVWMISLLLKSAGAVLTLGTGHGLFALVLMECGLVVLVDVVLAWFAFRSVPHLRLSWSQVNRRDARRLVGLGGLMFVGQLCTLVIEQTDRLVIGAALPIAMVTYYSAAWKLYMLAYLAPTVLLYAWPPMAAALVGRGDRDRLRALVLQMSKYAGAVAIPIVAIAGLGAGPLLRLWMGADFVAVAGVTQLLLLSLLVTAFNHAGAAALVALDRVGPLVWWYTLPQAVMNLGLSLALVAPLGLAGVALGTLLPAVLLQPIFVRVLAGELGIRWQSWVSRAVAPLVLPALCFGPAIVLASRWPVDAPARLVCALAAAVAYVVVFLAVSLSAGERLGLSAIVRRRAASA